MDFYFVTSFGRQSGRASRATVTTSFLEIGKVSFFFLMFVALVGHFVTSFWKKNYDYKSYDYNKEDSQEERVNVVSVNNANV